MVSNTEIFAYFVIFFIVTLIGFVFIYKYTKITSDNHKPEFCIESILARCAPADKSEQLIRQDKARARGGLSLDARDFYTEEKRREIISRYVSEDDPKYSKIFSLFADAFNRGDEEMLNCLDRYMTTFNYEPSCVSVQTNVIKSEQLILYFLIVIIVAIFITLICYGISSLLS